MTGRSHQPPRHRDSARFAATPRAIGTHFANSLLFVLAIAISFAISFASTLAIGESDVVAQEPEASRTTTEIVVVVGAEGDPAYGKQFREWAGRWETAARTSGAKITFIGLEPLAEGTGTLNDRDRLRQLLQTPMRREAAAGSEQPALWLVLIGHGTYDGKVARFNLRGPDVSAAECREWLTGVERLLAVINCSSSSGPFLNEMTGPNRVVITATKSGHEYNFARFGDFLSRAVIDPAADLDKDEQTSLLEAFLKASADVREFYDGEARLTTEHALLDDNGDRLGTPADWFRGVRAIKTAKSGAAPDGALAARFHLTPSRAELALPEASRARRDEIERELAALRKQKPQLAEDDYLTKLEPLLVELSRLYSEKGTGVNLVK